MIIIGIKELMLMIAGAVTVACYLWCMRAWAKDKDDEYFPSSGMMPPLFAWIILMAVWLVCWKTFV
jgi:hypothetical protein